MRKLRHVDVRKVLDSAGKSGQDGLDNGCLWSSSIVRGAGSVEESWREREGGLSEAQVGVVLGPGIAGFVAPFGMCLPHRFDRL